MIISTINSVEFLKTIKLFFAMEKLLLSEKVFIQIGGPIGTAIDFRLNPQGNLIEVLVRFDWNKAYWYKLSDVHRCKHN